MCRSRGLLSAPIRACGWAPLESRKGPLARNGKSCALRNEMQRCLKFRSCISLESVWGKSLQHYGWSNERPAEKGTPSS